MRTLLLTMASLIVLALKAQIGQVVLPDPGITENEWARAALTVGNMKPYMSDDTISVYAKKNCVRLYGLEGCRQRVLTISLVEKNGTFGSGNGYGPAEVQPSDVYQDYRNRMKGKPGFVDFKVEELDDSMKVRLTLALLDWHMGSPASYKLNTEELWVKAWRVGPKYCKPNLTRADFKNDADWALYPAKQKEAANYWEAYKRFKYVVKEQERQGISHFL